METIKNKEYFKALAYQCMFECSDNELDEIAKEFAILEQQMKLLEEVNTEGVEPMVYPFEMETTYLREDVVDHVITQEQALSNVAKTRNGHVLVPKVIK